MSSSIFNINAHAKKRLLKLSNHMASTIPTSMRPELASSGFCQTQRLCEDLMDFFHFLHPGIHNGKVEAGGEFLLRPMGVDAVANRHLEHQMGHWAAHVTSELNYHVLLANTCHILFDAEVPIHNTTLKAWKLMVFTPDHWQKRRTFLDACGLTAWYGFVMGPGGLVHGAIAALCGRSEFRKLRCVGQPLGWSMARETSAKCSNSIGSTAQQSLCFQEVVHNKHQNIRISPRFKWIIF